MTAPSDFAARVAEAASTSANAIEAMGRLVPLIAAIGPTLADVVSRYSKAGVRAAAGELAPGEQQTLATEALSAVADLVDLHSAAADAFGKMAQAVEAADRLARLTKSATN